MFAVDFAQPAKSKPLPTIYIATTTTGIPYGKDRSLDRSGHSKPKHLTNGLAAVEEQGLALVVADADPKSDKSSDTFYVDMVLPAAGTITVNGETILPSNHLNRPVKPGEVIGVRVGASCFAMLPFAAAGPGEAQALLDDDDGVDAGALRFSTRFKVQTHTEAMKSAYLVLTQACSGSGNSAVEALRAAKVGAQNLPHQWTVDAALGNVALRVSYDLEAHEAIQTSVNGVPFTTLPLHVMELKQTDKKSAAAQK